MLLFVSGKYKNDYEIRERQHACPYLLESMDSIENEKIDTKKK